MSFQATINESAQYVRVLDTGMQRIYFLTFDAWRALDQVSPGAQARLAAAAEFSLDGHGDMLKAPMRPEALITHYLQLRAGQGVKITIPAAVRDAVRALNGAVAAAS